MPEFVMENKEQAARTETPFVLGFIEAMFFTTVSPAFDSEQWFSDECKAAQEAGTADGELPGDVGYADLHPDSLSAIRTFCEKFQKENAAALAFACEQVGYSEERAGNDLWFTSQGHGVGYWDRKELKIEYNGTGDSIGDVLTAAAENNEIHVFFGDHVIHGNAPFVHVDLP